MKHEQLFQRLNELSVKQLEFQRRVSEIAQPTLTQPKSCLSKKHPVDS